MAPAEWRRAPGGRSSFPLSGPSVREAPWTLDQHASHPSGVEGKEGRSWAYHYGKLLFRDSDVTGVLAAVRAALEDAKGAVRRALDRVGSDNRVEAAQQLQFAEGCCRRARFLVARYTAPPGQPGDPEARL